MRNLIITLAQINLTVGDLDNNYQLIVDAWQQAENLGTELVVFPELTISGYSPQDLALRHGYIENCNHKVQLLIEQSLNFSSAIIVGTITRKDDKIYNSALVIYKGEILHHHDKMFLPNYGVFDEQRIFSPQTLEQALPFTFKSVNIGILICEDIWYLGSCTQLKNHDAELIIVINASPYSKFKSQKRLSIVKQHQRYVNIPIIYLNQVGGQDSVIYDGGSFILNSNNNIALELPSFESKLETFQTNILFGSNLKQNIIAQELPKYSGLDLPIKIIKDIYHALMLALKDYLIKNNINEIVLGFSSGIDSSLTAAIAMDAIGRDKVHLVALPSSYTSSTTLTDTNRFMECNKTTHLTLSINNVFRALLTELNPYFSNKVEDTAEQNLQSRIRGTILMALANKHHYLLLSTGNKSELAVGYATLYGDMNGGYNLLKDLYKLEIYQLADWRNNNIPSKSLHPYSHIIPENIINKAPTAELKPDQKDEDSLPPYDILDNILYNYIEKRLSKSEIIQLGFNTEIVDQVLNLVRIAQFKRQQATLGPKVSEVSFDLDWRYPITNKFY